MDDYVIWAGDSRASYDAVVEARASLRVLATTVQASGGGFPDTPPPWEKQGSVGVVPVKGSLISGSAGWLSMFGVTGYDDIASGLLAAVQDPDVKSILLHVNSGGGATKGVQALADFIGKVSKVKPVNAHIDGVGASAAYWLASAANTISMDPMGEAGSLGTVVIHTSTARAEADNGIDRTVIRSGKYKMITNPHEPLSDLAKSELQSKVDDLASMFEQHVAAARHTTQADVHENMGQGRTFLGKRAKAVGLVDKLSSFDDALSAAKKIDKAKSVP